jgi:hypothetical protein
MLVSCLAYAWTLKMKATYSFETSVDFQRTTQRYIAEDITLLMLKLCTRFYFVARKSNYENEKRFNWIFIGLLDTEEVRIFEFDC